jgi:MFS family permease
MKENEIIPQQERLTNKPVKQSTSSSSSAYTTKIPASAWKVLIILGSITTMTMYAETMLIPAIPDLIKDFHVSYGISSWILTAYLTTAAVMTPIAGKLSDIYGKKKVLLTIMLIYAIGISMAGFSTNIYFLLITRAIQGFGMSVFPIVFSIVRDKFPREKMSIGNGIISSLIAAGAVIGLMVGGTIIRSYGWQATFFTIIPIAITLLITIWRFIHIDEQKLGRKRHRQQALVTKETSDSRSSNNNNYNDYRKYGNNSTIDIKGAITLAITITSFLLVLTYLETGNSNSSSANNSSVVSGSTIQITGFVSTGVVSVLLFILIERRSANPLIDFRLLLHKSILPSNLLIMIVGFSTFMIFQTVPIILRNPSPLGFGENAVSSGNIVLPFALVFLVFGPTSGYIITKLGSLKPIIFGSIITTVGFFGLLVFHSTEFSISTNLAILATGFSLTIVGVMNVVVLSTPKQYSGISLGTTMLMRIVGSAIGPALAGMYMQSNQSIINIGGIIQHLPSGEFYNLIFITGILLSVITIILAILLRRRAIKMAIPNLV